MIKCHKIQSYSKFKQNSRQNSRQNSKFKLFKIQDSSSYKISSFSRCNNCTHKFDFFAGSIARMYPDRSATQSTRRSATPTTGLWLPTSPSRSAPLSRTPWRGRCPVRTACLCPGRSASRCPGRRWSTGRSRSAPLSQRSSARRFQSKTATTIN